MSTILKLDISKTHMLVISKYLDSAFVLISRPSKFGSHPESNAYLNCHHWTHSLHKVTNILGHLSQCSCWGACNSMNMKQDSHQI